MCGHRLYVFMLTRMVGPPCGLPSRQSTFPDEDFLTCSLRESSSGALSSLPSPGFKNYGDG